MSSGSESDDDYVPDQNPEKLSEEESADDETEKQFENEEEQKIKKRKLIEEIKGKKKRKSTRSNPNETEEIDELEEKATEELDPEEQKKKDDDLWAMFLDGTDTKPKPKETPTTTSKVSTSTVPPKLVVNKPETKDKDDAKEKEKRIFEFAGETIVVEDNVIKERIKTGESPATVSNLPAARASTGGGVSGLLGALNKKNKLSILEKSKLDWTTLKKDEGIEEEIQSHNKGKHGFLERRDFLERADMRQYEIERDIRMNRRSNR